MWNLLPLLKLWQQTERIGYLTLVLFSILVSTLEQRSDFLTLRTAVHTLQNGLEFLSCGFNQSVEKLKHILSNISIFKIFQAKRTQIQDGGCQTGCKWNLFDSNVKITKLSTDIPNFEIQQNGETNVDTLRC